MGKPSAGGRVPVGEERRVCIRLLAWLGDAKTRCAVAGEGRGPREMSDSPQRKV